jgi:hypothetical protein
MNKELCIKVGKWNNSVSRRVKACSFRTLFSALSITSRIFVMHWKRWTFIENLNVGKRKLVSNGEVWYAGWTMNLSNLLDRQKLLQSSSFMCRCTVINMNLSYTIVHCAVTRSNLMWWCIVMQQAPIFLVLQDRSHLFISFKRCSIMYL